MKNLDFKSILIIVLLVISGLFFSMWYLKGSDYKDKFDQLEQDFNKSQKTRDSLKLVNDKLEKEFDRLNVVIKDREEKIKLIEKEIENLNKDLIETKRELASNRKILEETKKKIEELKKNPIKREDEQLINSLKEKLKN